MIERQEVRILIGKRNYRMQTDLDESEVLRVTGIVKEIARTIGDNLDQDKLLLLTCLHLAYNMEKISKTLEQLLDKIENATPWESGAESK